MFAHFINVHSEIISFFLWFQTQNRSTNHFQTGQFESARVPSIGKSQSGGEADGQTEEMLKILRGILNKLTPERFEGLMKQVDELNIDNEECLKAVIELIFKKAVSEQSYSMAYAKMCHHMKGVKFSNTSHSLPVCLVHFVPDYC